ncbi:MAG: hypothetical protein AB1758_04515 [Candidatus Eremiobacterota bacterium]
MSAQNSPQEPRASLLTFMLPLLLIWTAFLIWSHKRPKPTVDHTPLCTAQAESIGHALDARAAYHEGTFPAHLDELVPLYLPRVPDCEGKAYRYEVAPERFTLICPGGHGQFVHGKGFEKAP